MATSQDIARVIIVEDEYQARRYLRELLAGEETIAIVGEAGSGAEGVDLIRRMSPDMVFLDIQMPDFNGFDLIAQIGVRQMPVFIFVTAYPDYAVRAFGVEAVDYICKPFDRDRLSASVERALRRLQIQDSIAAAEDLSAAPVAVEQWLSRITIKENEGIIFVPVNEVLWIEAADKYVVIHTAHRNHLARQTIQSLENRLDPKDFVRIHRSTIVRKAVVRGLHPLFHGDYIVRLTDGAELTLSRNYRESFFHQMSL